MRNELTMLWAWVVASAHTKSREVTENERGASTLEYVLMAVGLAGLAIVVVGILTGKITGMANSIPTN
jgi:Flp pilus assembly pilin Flp